jgi:RimJ/RimL family protein N-acetyltransferase
MLYAVDFDQQFLKRSCYRLRPAVTGPEWRQLEQLALDNPIFADLKCPASDLSTADQALQRSFRKICTQTELTHPLTHVQPAQHATLAPSLALTPEQRRAHSEHFASSRFRQDPNIPYDVANDLYEAWIANSLNGSKRLAVSGVNFCSFEDRHRARHIDLLSVLDKGRGHASDLLRAVVSDAKSCNLDEVVVTTETENELALKTYRAAGFQFKSFTSVFHFWN